MLADFIMQYDHLSLIITKNNNIYKENNASNHFKFNEQKLRTS